MIDPKYIYMLKEIALTGGRDGFVEISTSELGKKIGISQQSASRWLGELENNGLIQKKKLGRKISVKITRKGMDILRHESFDYRRIFESPKYLELTGEVITGLGEGRYYITRKGYYNQIKEKLFFEPYPGTLNVRIYPGDLEKVDLLRSIPGISLQGFVSQGRTFGNVKAFLCTINGVEAALIMPERSHYTDVVEIIANKNLRKKLTLKDGSAVDIVVYL